MQSPDVTDYIQALDEPKRGTLERLRELVHSIEPELEEVIAWRAPMFRLRGKNVVGVCAHKNHFSFSPQSATVMEAHEEALTHYVVSKGSFQFAVDWAIDAELVESLIKARIAELS
jgi:uncharacterized protein YdhG (YjbR/CyaY superfamily)